MNNLLILITLLGLIYLVSQFKTTFKLPYHNNIEKLTLENRNYRQVLYTTKNLQLVLMSLKSGEEIGSEIHPQTSQFIRIESGHAKAIINGQSYSMQDGDVMVVPPGSEHNFINISKSARLQLYSIYTPPEHPPKTIQKNKPNK